MKQPTSIEEAKNLIDQEVKANDIVVFMKGAPDFPMCGFSGRVVSIFRHLGRPIKGINVLESEAMRQGIKDYSNWPTIPEIYIRGEFIGGSTSSELAQESRRTEKRILNEELGEAK